MFACLSPGLVCICVYFFPHIRVWICVQDLLCCHLCDYTLVSVHTSLVWASNPALCMYLCV